MTASFLCIPVPAARDCKLVSSQQLTVNSQQLTVNSQQQTLQPKSNSFICVNLCSSACICG
ncbi:hypothetical protein IQ252_08225 [Tychonema sp. LEGE 07203]|nr:hypothetical protein [Tychonema sp. LEGE 07203]